MVVNMENPAFCEFMIQTAHLIPPLFLQGNIVKKYLQKKHAAKKCDPRYKIDAI